MPDALAPEKSLLFALLAFQNGFIQREQLLAALGSWMADKSRPLDAILVEQSAISHADREILKQLVERHVRHVSKAEDPQRSVLEQLHTVRDALLKNASGDQELSQAFQTLAADETVVFQQQRQDMAEVALSSNRFRLIKEHAKGGLGRVFLAEDLKFGREVALKQIRAEYAHKEEYRAKFLLEAEVTGQLEHPGIVPVYALGEDELGQPFYAMRFIRGEELKSRIKTLHRQCPVGQVRLQGPELRQLLRHFIDACHAINYAHDRGVLHRDLKPSNIMLGKHGETLVVDWGLAKPLGVKLNQTNDASSLPDTELPLGTSDTASGSETRYGSFVGTAAYAPPEQVLGSLDKLGPTSDVYSLGAILYELLAGQPPLVGKEVEAMIRKVTCGEIIPVLEHRPDAPAALVAVCRKAMSLAQEDRYPTVAELRRDIQRWLDDLPVAAYHEPRRQQAARWLRRHPRWVAALASALVIGAVGIAIGSLLIKQKNVVLQEKNLALEASQLEANQRRLDAEAALYDSLVLQAQLLVRQAGYPGWSWEAEQKLAQASQIIPDRTDQHRLRTLLLASTYTLDFRSVAKLLDGIDCETLCFSPDGRYLAIGQRKHNLASSVFIFETTRWQLTQKLSVSAADGGLAGLGDAAVRFIAGERFQEGVLALAFSPDGRWLAAGTRLGRIHTWPAEDDFQFTAASANDSARHVNQSSHDSPSRDRMAASADDTVRHVNWQAFAQGGVAELVFAPKGEHLWASSDGSGNHQCLGWTWQNNVWTPAAERLVDASTELVGNGRGLLASLSGGQLKWFDGRSLSELQHPSLPVGNAQAVALALTTNQVAYAVADAVVVRDLETGRDTQLQDINPESLSGHVGLSFDGTGEWLAITAALPQVSVVATVNSKLAKRVIPVPGRNQPTASFSQVGGLLAVTTERGVEVYQQRSHLAAITPVDFPGNERIEDVALSPDTIWAIAHAADSAPPIYQLRQFPRGQWRASGIGTLFCENDSAVGHAGFMSIQPLRLSFPAQAVMHREPNLQQFRIKAAITESGLLTPEAAQRHLIESHQSQLKNGHVCLNGPAEMIAENLGRVAELQVTDSGRAAFGLTSDGDGVLCLRLSDFSVLGEWSSHLESNLTGNARPLSVSVTGELAVIGGSDGIVHVIQTDGRVIGRGQFSDANLLALDAQGEHFIVGAFNGDAMVASLDQLNQPRVWHAHSAPVTAVAMQPSGDGFATGSRAGQVTWWRRQAGSLQPVVSFPVARQSVKRLRFDASGERLAIIVDDSSTAQVWDLTQLREYFESFQLAW